MPRPKPKSSLAEREMDKAQEQFDNFDNALKKLNTMEKPPAKEEEPQTKMSNREVAKYDAPYIKPSKSMFPSCDKTGRTETFNEAFRKDREERSKYCKCIVENKEIRGETVELWTRPWGGTPALFWQIPVNKPVYIPIYVAEHLAKRSYQRIVMQEDRTYGVGDYGSKWTGVPVAEESIQRIDCKAAGRTFVAFQGV